MLQTTESFHIDYCEEEMLPYAFVYLREKYPGWKGWRMNYVFHEELMLSDFVIQRITRYRTYYAIAHVVVTESISKWHLQKLERAAALYRQNPNCIVEKIIIIPAGCATGIIPKHIKIIQLKEFSILQQHSP